MDLYKRIEDDMKAALKEGASDRLSVLRMVVSAVKTFQIDKNLKSAQEADVLQILQKQVKQRRESIEQFRSGNRQDLADKEAKELKILESYLPEQLGEAELEALVKAAIAETGAATKADTGKVMKAVMDKARGKADGKAINQAVMKFLK
jgi:uncharacterized protein YqeY